MSNFSNIGLNVATQEEFQQLLEKAYKASHQIKVNEGAYSIYTDSSGAELFIQFNKKNECIGANPHFKGKSKRTVCLTNIIERAESELDGAFHCWADPLEVNNPESGAYPFVFDLPDIKTIGQIDFPKNFDIQLTAFAQELSIYDSEKDFNESQTTEPKFASQSFIPNGLFSLEEGKDNNPPQALGIFTGVIKQVERKRNEMTSEEFYWLLVDTLGGEVDVVADVRFFEKEPIINGIVQGQFWLSGQLINPPARELKESKTFLQRLFRR
jgi:hypothetical protein